MRYELEAGLHSWRGAGRREQEEGCRLSTPSGGYFIGEKRWNFVVLIKQYPVHTRSRKSMSRDNIR